MRILKVDESRHKTIINRDNSHAANKGKCDFDEKQNATKQVKNNFKAGKRKALSIGGTKLSRTPPRYRRSCDNNLSTNDPKATTSSESKKMMKEEISERNTDDDFSFQHLKGKLLKFEKTQRERIENNTPQKVINRVPVKFEKASLEKISSRRTIKASRNFINSPKNQRCLSNETSPRSDPSKQIDNSLKSSKDAERVQNESSSSNDNGDDDFSFHNLRQKANDLQNRNIEKHLIDVENAEQLCKKASITLKNINEHQDAIAQGSRDRTILSVFTDNSKSESSIDENSNSFKEQELVKSPIKKFRGIETYQMPSTQKNSKFISYHPENQTDQGKMCSASLLKTNQMRTPTPIKRSSAIDNNEVSKLRSVKSTPRYRFKPRIKKEEVQATDDSKASVQKLAKWLSDDPFEKQKVREIKKGATVFAKSQAFEDKDCTVVLKNQAHDCFKAGKVQGRKNWLETVFKPDESLEEEEKHQSVSDKKKWLEEAFKKKATPGSAMKPHIHGTFVPISIDKNQIHASL